jgi:hypothetical protein
VLVRGLHVGDARARFGCSRSASRMASDMDLRSFLRLSTHGMSFHLCLISDR